MEFIHQIFSGLFSSSVIIALIVFSGRKYIDRYFASTLTQFEHDLSLIKAQHDIKFSILHEERAKQCRNLYLQIRKLESSLNTYTTIFQGPGWQEDNERFQNVLNERINLQEQIEDNRIYFTDEFCLELEAIYEKVETIVRRMEEAKLLQMRYEQGDMSVGSRPISIWREQNEEVLVGFRSLRRDLANQFRKLIGVEIG
ncbi:hypothetical protein GYB22_11915 [bacterium]|nr:hypothetical protein [bacterium]